MGKIFPPVMLSLYSLSIYISNILHIYVKIARRISDPINNVEGLNPRMAAFIYI